MNIDNLWIEYGETKDRKIKNILIENYIHLVKIVAGRMYNFYGGKVEYDDLIGYGSLGLIDSIDRFDISKNIKFETIKSDKKTNATANSTKKTTTVGNNTKSEDKKEEVVYITKSGKKYHRAGCKYLKSSQIKISKKEAIKKGYTPCSICNP